VASRRAARRQTWVAARSGEATRRNARAALVWRYRVELGQALDIPWVSQSRRAPRAFTADELAVLRDVAPGVHRRCRPTVDLLYTTGARVGLLCAVELDDVTDTHVLLRRTKLRPGGIRVERAIPLNETSREAVRQLQAMPGGRRNNLLGACQHLVQDWMVVHERRTAARPASRCVPNPRPSPPGRWPNGPKLDQYDGSDQHSGQQNREGR
jgi:integrase